MAVNAGSYIGSYEIVAAIAAGGMGKVSRALALPDYSSGGSPYSAVLELVVTTI